MEIRRLIAPIKRSIRLLISKAVVKAIYDGEDETLQKLQLSILKDELRDRVERYQNYGFSSHPHAGAEAAVVFPSGSRDRGIVLAVDDRRYRIKSLKPGEVAIYTDEKDHIILKRGNKIELKTKTFIINADDECRVASKNIIFDGHITATKDMAIAGNAVVEKVLTVGEGFNVPDFIVDGISLKNHTHPLQIDKNITATPTPTEI